ncbi:hypothetical protein [Paenibacillus mucilaginosus]|uniref:hypothetical protein n=1 Tax=Paenibacillus mucilaginosus TaxID=61624 RepID=UPI003D22A548
MTVSRFQIFAIVGYRLIGLFLVLQGIRILLREAGGDDTGYAQLGLFTPGSEEGMLAYAGLLLAAGIVFSAVLPFILRRQTLGRILLCGAVLSLGFGLLCARAASDLPPMAEVGVSLFGMFELYHPREQALYGRVLGGLAAVLLLLVPAGFLIRWHAMSPTICRKTACILLFCLTGAGWAAAGESSGADAEGQVKATAGKYAAALLSGKPEEAATYGESRHFTNRQSQIVDDKRIAKTYSDVSVISVEPLGRHVMEVKLHTVSEGRPHEYTYPAVRRGGLWVLVVGTLISHEDYMRMNQILKDVKAGRLPADALKDAQPLLDRMPYAERAGYSGGQLSS